ARRICVDEGTGGTHTPGLGSDWMKEAPVAKRDLFYEIQASTSQGFSRRSNTGITMFLRYSTQNPSRCWDSRVSGPEPTASSSNVMYGEKVRSSTVANVFGISTLNGGSMTAPCFNP